jgi:hypothetical protein
MIKILVNEDDEEKLEHPYTDFYQKIYNEKM